MSKMISVKSDVSQIYDNRDVASLLSYWADARPDHPFIIWVPFEGGDQQWTYSEFFEQVKSLAAGFEENNLGLGDRVLIHLDNCPEFLLAWYACALLGATAVTTNTRSAEDELRYFADFAEVKAIITQPAYKDLVNKAILHHQSLKWIAVTDNDGGLVRNVSDDKSFTSLFKKQSEIECFKLRPCDPMLDVSIQFTSGTTSRPKAVVWTHANALWGGQINARHESLCGDDRHLVFLPLFHANAMSYSVLSSLWIGSTIILQPKFSASRFWPVSLKYRCTWCSMVPFVYKAILDQQVPEHHYRYWGMGAVASFFESHFKVKTIGWWGMTETISHGIVSESQHKLPMGAIGRPAPEYQIAIVDDDGVPVSQGQSGHLLIKGVRGVSLFKEYLNNDLANKESFDENGWFRTGDRIRLNEAGDLFFADRDKDMLKVGGENVAASEIERVIAEVKGVDELAVVAKKDKMLDEIPVAFIIKKSTMSDAKLEEAIRANCEQKLADFKRPRDIIFVSELPRSVLEKVNKKVLRDRLK